ncbi:MAG: tyrosine-protein kinase domain-containing protein [Mycobacteriales bacterium]
MDLQDYLRVLRKRWRLIVVCTLVAVAAATAVTYEMKPSYAATAQLFVSTRNAPGDIAGIYTGQQFAQAGVTSYSDIVTSPKVLAPVISSLALPMTVSQLSHEVSASSPLNTVLINIKATDRYPARAQAIANAVAAQFATVIEQLETPTSGGASPVKVTVVQPASRPTAPVSPRKKLNLGLGLLVGLAIGVGGAVLRETLDRSVRTPDELAEITEAATIGLIAYDPEISKHPLAVVSAPHSAVSESFRQLRTNLQFVNVDQAPRSIVFTSSVPGEGKTTTVCNLAVALGQAGLSCLLVEADLRRAKIGQYMGIDSSVGLTNVLTGQVSLADAAQSWGKDGLQVLPSGPLPPNPSELLGSQNMRSLLAEAQAAFDVVLLDAPPLLPVTDAAVVAGVADGAILVVHAGATHREQVARASEALRTVGARLFGTVLAMVATKGPDAYNYGYGYGYTTRSADARRSSRSHRQRPEDHQQPPLQEQTADLSAFFAREGSPHGDGGRE